MKKTKQKVVALANAEKREQGVVLSMKDGGFGFVQSPTRDQSVRTLKMCVWFKCELFLKFGLDLLSFEWDSRCCAKYNSSGVITKTRRTIALTIWTLFLFSKIQIDRTELEYEIVEDRDDKSKHAAIRLRVLPRGTVKVCLCLSLCVLAFCSNELFLTNKLEEPIVGRYIGTIRTIPHSQSNNRNYQQSTFVVVVWFFIFFENNRIETQRETYRSWIDCYHCNTNHMLV